MTAYGACLPFQIKPRKGGLGGNSDGCNGYFNGSFA
jgi:hypothetical protein